MHGADQVGPELAAQRLHVAVHGPAARAGPALGGRGQPFPGQYRARPLRQGDQLLDLSRMEAGALRLERTVFAVEPLLTEVVAEAAVSSMASGRGTRFQVVVRPPGLTGYADRGRLYQVLANLLDNAARHGPAGGQVRVEAFGDGGDLVVEVVDEGPGIEPADRDRIFERFIRGGPAGGGTGLGLAIARWAVDLHGGRIAVAEPAPGETGCRIRVRLPDRPR